MTIQQKFRECERLYCQMRKDDPESVKRYQTAVKELEQMRKEANK